MYNNKKQINAKMAKVKRYLICIYYFVRNYNTFIIIKMIRIKSLLTIARRITQIISGETVTSHFIALTWRGCALSIKVWRSEADKENIGFLQLASAVSLSPVKLTFSEFS